MIRFFRKYHKWIGLFFTFFLLMFALSGIFLNHRKALSSCDIPRKWLPENYKYNNWNNGAVTGTLNLSADSVVMYGSGGVWLTDTLCRTPRAFCNGMPSGADNRYVRAMAVAGKQVFAITAFQLYRLNNSGSAWEEITSALNCPDYFSDIYTNADSLYLLSRSHIYVAGAPYTVFHKIELKAPEGYSGKVSLFRTFWLLHSGELFGISGKLVVDMLGVITVILCITGLVVTFLRIPIKRRRRIGNDAVNLKRKWKLSLNWHNRFGHIFFVLLLLIAITGMFLRPPLLIPIVRATVPPIPGSTLHSHNPWHDKLRKIRFDANTHKWMIATSEGFYTCSSPKAQPHKIDRVPPVSVMGVTVWEPTDDGSWIVGSFSGLYLWHTDSGMVKDLYTGKMVVQQKHTGRPTFTNAVSGFSSDFSQGDVVFDYNKGARMLSSNQPFAIMPSEFYQARMSLWHFCLELHVGRMYAFFMRGFTDFYIFFAGLLFIGVLVSGYGVYVKRYKQSRRKDPKNTHLKDMTV